MKNKVILLDENSCNKIAAGEVIENPASVVKELIENAIDAGSSEIVVEIYGGGLSSIKVSDNGSGMNKEDALMSLQRHATSKIHNSDEIENVSTMGFRGEAIPSISSISKFTLTTNDSNDVEKGTSIYVEGGVVIEVKSAHHRQGTSVEVQSLFFNVPVRKKFQKSASYNAGEVNKKIISLALANPTIAIKFVNNSKEMFYLPSSDNFMQSLQERFSTFFDFSAKMIPLENEEGDYCIKGIVGPISLTKNSRRWQYVFVNSRAIRAPVINAIIQEVYGTSIDNGKFPVFAIHLMLPKDIVDVNVHPQKTEIRIRESGKMKRMLIHAINGVLHTVCTHFPQQIYSQKNCFSEINTKKTVDDIINDEVYKRQYHNCYNKKCDIFENANDIFYNSFKSLGIVANYFIVDLSTVKRFFQGIPGILIVNIPAVESRVIFETLKKNMPTVSTKIFPLTITLSKIEDEQMSSCLPILKNLGITFERDKTGTYTLVECIKWLEKYINKEWILSLVEELLEFDESSFTENIVTKKLSHIAIQMSKKKKIYYNEDYGKMLLETLLTMEDPLHSPRNEKTIKIITSKDLDVLFKCSS